MHSPVPQFVRSLSALSAILAKAQAFEEARRLRPDVIPNLRLIADMLPFWRQITIACDHAKGASARLAGVEVPSFPDEERTLGDLQDRVARTIAFIQSIPSEAYDAAEGRSITLKAGGRDLTLAAPQYFNGYAIPNFYFHMTTAYNILRGNGLEIGKTDFLGA